MTDAVSPIRAKVKAVIASLSPEPNHPEGPLLDLATAFDAYLAESAEDKAALAETHASLAAIDDKYAAAVSAVDKAVEDLTARLADVEKTVKALSTPAAPPAPPPSAAASVKSKP